MLTRVVLVIVLLALASTATAQTPIFSEIPIWRSNPIANNYDVALGDVDLDGDLDLVFASWGDITPAWYENLGATINPDPAWMLPVSDTTVCLALGDVNGDGLLDLVCGNYYSQPCKLYLNTGQGFADTPAWVASRADNTHDIKLGDVDGDGDLDLICANMERQNTLYLNIDGIFSTDPDWLSTPVFRDRTSCVALGDVDGDGDLDAVFGQDLALPLMLYENTGGVFTTDPVWMSGDSLWTEDVEFGDIDGDGDLDLVRGVHGRENRLYENTGAGLDSLPVWQSSERFYTWDIALGDVDGDGDLDLVCGNKVRRNTCYENTGNWFTTDPVWYSQAEAATFGVALGDLNGDGAIDMVCADGYSDRNAVYDNLIIGFSKDPVWTAGAGFTAVNVALGDITGDGYPDLVCGTIGSIYPDAAYFNAGGTFPSSYQWSSNTFFWTSSVNLSDIDDDGDLDVIISEDEYHESVNYLYENRGPAGIGSDPAWMSTDTSRAEDAALADIDGDGDLDLLNIRPYNSVDGSIGTVYENTGAWFTQSPIAKLPGNSSAYGIWDLCLAAGDVNLDGLADVVIGVYGAPLQLIQNTGRGTSFENVWLSAVSEQPRSLALGDIDGDGDLDLICGNSSEFAGAPNSIYENTGGIFTDNPVWQTSLTWKTRGVAVGDVDGDGDLDLVFGNQMEPNTLYKNTSTGLENSPTWQAGLNDYKAGIAMDDVDRDGDLDLVVGASGPVTMYTGSKNPAYKGNCEAPTNHTPNNPAFVSLASAVRMDDDTYVVTFTAKDVESDRVWITGDYQFEGEPVWRPMELAGGGRRDGPIIASPSGVTDSLLWDVFLVPFDHRNLVLRLKTIEIPRRLSDIQSAATYNLMLGRIVPVRPELSTSVDTLMFSDSTVTLGDTISLDLSVINSGTGDLNVVRINLPSTEMYFEHTTPFSLAPGQSEVIEVFLAPRSETIIGGNITVESNDPINPVRSIPVRTDIRQLAFSSKLFNPASELPLGQAVIVVVTLEPEVRIENGYVLHRMSGSSEFRDSVVVEPFEDQFVATIRGEYVREAGLEYYVRVENSGVFSTDPPRAPVDSVYSRDVEQPYAIFSSPVPNLGTDFLEGLDVKVQVSLPDGAVFGNGYVFYRAGGETVYNSVIIGPGDPAPFAVIPDSVTGSTGIEYWALVHTLTRTLTDPASDPAGSPYAIRITTPNLAETRSHAGNQFRMLSIPLDIEAPITGIVTDDLGGPDPTRWRMFAYDPGRYVELPSESITQFEQGRAYWLISREPHRLDTSPATGVSTPTDTPFEIELQPGWNLLGDPFNFSVTWDSCVVDTMTMANAEGAVVEPPVTWNGTGYSHGTRTLKPFGGCWVKNLADSAVTLLIPPISADGATPQILAAEYIAGDNNWFIEIVARCGDREDAYNIAGIAEGADNNWDRNDRSEPPASPGGGVSMYFPHDDWTYHPGNYTVDMRGDYQPIEKSMLSRVAHDNTMWGHTWWFDVAATSDAEVALDFTPVNLPAEAIAYVVDISSGTTVDLLSQPRYIFYTGDKTSQFALLVGSEEFVEESRDQLPGPPTQTVLHQNVPNPFNPTTTIRYELATASHVDLRVYDVSGALVRVLEDRDLPVGRYEAVWTGENDTGQRVSSGVYFYRLTADGAVTTRKMLLLK